MQNSLHNKAQLIKNEQ